MPIYNYKKDQDLSLDKYPVNSHLCVETSVGLYFVDNADRTKVYSIDVSDGTQVQVDVDPSNTSGDAKSRDRDIIAAWHDRANEIIRFVDCDNPDTQFDVWYLDYSGGLGSESVTEVDSETGLTAAYVMDIYKISTSFFVSCINDSPAKIEIFDVTTSPFSSENSAYIGALGFYGGGAPAAGTSDVIDYIDMTTTSGNATDRGDLTVSREAVSGTEGQIYGFFGGGYTGSNSNIIDYIDMTTTSGNASDKGDLIRAKYSMGGVNGKTYGFFGGGYSAGRLNEIDYIDVTTTSGNATDKGDLTVARDILAGVGSLTYGFFGGGGGGAGVYYDTIDYIDVTTTSGNASDKGDLTVARWGVGGVSGSIYGFFGGGYTGAASNIVDYIDITTLTGNAADKGDLTVARRGVAGTDGSVYGFFGGGITSNVVDYINSTTTSGNAADKGDLTVARGDLGGVN